MEKKEKIPVAATSWGWITATTTVGVQGGTAHTGLGSCSVALISYRELAAVTGCVPLGSEDPPASPSIPPGLRRHVCVSPAVTGGMDAAPTSLPGHLEQLVASFPFGQSQSWVTGQLPCRDR